MVALFICAGVGLRVESNLHFSLQREFRLAGTYSDKRATCKIGFGPCALAVDNYGAILLP